MFVSTIKRYLYQLSKDICINYQKIFVSTIKRYLYPLSKDICINYQKIFVSIINTFIKNFWQKGITFTFHRWANISSVMDIFANHFAQPHKN